MNIYLSYHPIELHSISIPIILTHNTIPLCKQYFNNINIIDFPKKYNQKFNYFKVETYNEYFINYINKNINLNEKNLLIGYGPWGFNVLFNENINLNKNCYRIIWQDDLHYFYKKKTDIFEVNNNLSKFKDDILDKCDLILTPSPIFFKNINSDYLKKTKFYFYGLDRYDPYFKSLKPFNERKNKILLSGNISGKTYPSRKFIQKKILRNTSKNNLFKKHFEYLPHPGYISSNNYDIQKIQYKYYDIIQDYKVAFIGLARKPINFLLSKIIETLYCGTLALIEKTPLLQEELGLIDGTHYISVEFNESLLLSEELVLDFFNNPKYQKIAENGKNFAIKNFNINRNAKYLYNISKNYLRQEL